MRKFLSASCLVILVILISIIPAYAYETSVEFKADCSYDETLNVVNLRVSINGIKDPTGIAGFECRIVTDPNIFEIKSVTPNIPDKWLPYFSEDLVEGVEDFSYLDSENPGTYVWAMVAIKTDIGITDDAQLYVDLQLVPLKEAETQIKIVPEAVTNDLFDDLGYNNIKITLNTAVPNDASVDTEINQSDLPENSESNSETSFEGNETGSPIVLNPVAENSEISEESNTVESGCNNIALISCLCIAGIAIVAIVIIVIIRSSNKTKVK